MMDAHRWSRIPATIRTDRTFARDEQEATCVDVMDTFMARVVNDGLFIRVRNLPLVAVGDSLIARWWNRFSFG